MANRVSSVAAPANQIKGISQASRRIRRDEVCGTGRLTGAVRSVASSTIGELSDDFSRPIVTEVRPAETFYVAEDYHQEYFRNNPQQPYCAFVVSPKVKKFREKFAAKHRRSAQA